jgi:hypothetical protein
MNLEDQNINSADRNLCNLWLTSFVANISLWNSLFEDV